MAGPVQQVEVRWRPSRHARRLLTLALAGLLLAALTRRPELVGVAAPALLLLGAALPGRAGRRSPSGSGWPAAGCMRENWPRWTCPSLTPGSTPGGCSRPAAAWSRPAR